MKINTKELSKTKSMAINLFKDNKVYSLNSNNSELVVISELSNVTFDKSFAIDNKAIDLIKRFEEPDLELDGTILVVKNGKVKFKIETFAYELPQFDLTNMQKCEVDLNILKTARKFTSKKDTRPVLTAVNLIENGNVYATDSYGLYRYEKTNSENDFTLKSINIPNTFIDLLEKTSDDSSNIELLFNDKCILVINNNIKYISRLIVGTFPNVNRVLNAHFNQHLTIDFSELKENIALADVIGTSKENNDNIVCRFKNEKLKCYGACEFETEFETINYSSDFEFSVVIDLVKLLLSCIDKNQSEITLEFEGGRNPISYKDELGQKVLITPIAKYY